MGEYTPLRVGGEGLEVQNNVLTQPTCTWRCGERKVEGGREGERWRYVGGHVNISLQYFTICGASITVEA